MFKKVLFFSVVFSCYIFADVQSSVGQKIQKLRDLPKAERFKLINEIKRDLTKLNSTQRRDAVGKLRLTIKAKHNQNQMKQHKLGKQHSQNSQNHQRKMDGSGPNNNNQDRGNQHQQQGQPHK